MITPRPHFEELDWLDYADGLLPAQEHATLERHLDACSDCVQRLAVLRQLRDALPHLDAHLTAQSPADIAAVSTLSVSAHDIIAGTARARAQLERAPDLPSPGAFDALSEYHIIAALEIARERFIGDLGGATRLVAWAAQAWQVLANRGPVRFPGLQGAVGSYQAYLELREGKPTAALATVDRVRPLLNEPMPLRDLAIAFWSYVRALCLQNLSRFPEAIRDIVLAENLYTAFGDHRHAARARLVRAMLLFDGGDPQASLPLLESLRDNPALREDPPIFAVWQLTLANNLVFVGDLARAKGAYARAVGLLKDSGQSDKLFRVRVGLADIAEREGRIEDALTINLSLRPEFLRRHLPWDEVRRELWIIRDLLALERYDQARATCRRLVPRARELSLGDEAIRALTYLAAAQDALDRDAVSAIEEDLTQIARGNPTRWSVA